MKVFYKEAESRKVESTVKTPDGDWITVTKPGRFTMREILEYSRRKSMTHNGKKVGRPMPENKDRVEGVTAERDEQLSKTPLLNIIRNPHAAYLVPYIPEPVKNNGDGTGLTDDEDDDIDIETDDEEADDDFNLDDF